MDSEKIITFFSRLTNADIHANSVISLSSGQASRAYAWLIKNGVAVKSSIFNGQIKISDFLEMGVSDGAGLIDASKDRDHPVIQSILLANNSSIGIDIQSISELFPDALPTDFKSDSQLSAIFTAKELSYAQSKSSPKETLTGIYAAKEAIFKCNPTQNDFLKIEILPGNDKKPYARNFDISISHSGEYAVAVAIPKSGIDPPVDFKEKTQLSFQESKLDAKYKLIYLLLIGLIIIEFVFHIALKIN